MLTPVFHTRCLPRRMVAVALMLVLEPFEDPPIKSQLASNSTPCRRRASRQREGHHPQGEGLYNAERFRRLAHAVCCEDDYWKRDDYRMLKDFSS
jgi:hypothetical protein